MAPPPVSAPLSVMLPAAPASRASAFPAVAMVELNRMFPAAVPVVSMSTAPPSVTARVKVILSSEVRMSPDVVSVPTRVAPKTTAPPALISPAAAMVVTPVESTLTVLLTAIAALMAMVVPAS